MLQADKAEDYVIATGETHSVREFCQLAFECAAIPIPGAGRATQSRGSETTAVCSFDDGHRLLSPTEVEHLSVIPPKARTKLGWTPKVAFEGLVKMMVESDLLSPTATSASPPSPMCNQTALSGRVSVERGARACSPPVFVGAGACPFPPCHFLVVALPAAEALSSRGVARGAREGSGRGHPPTPTPPGPRLSFRQASE